MTASANASFGYLAEQALHQIQPTPAGRREMYVVPGVPRQPSAHFGDFVRAVVVHHQMDVKTARKIGLDLIQKPQEFLVPMRR